MRSGSAGTGFTQGEGGTYFGMCALTPRVSSTRLQARVAVRNGVKLSHLDIQRAFVQPLLTVDIYMKLFPGCAELSGKIVKFNESLYGLKQASHESHQLLTTNLLDYRVEQCSLTLASSG